MRRHRGPYVVAIGVYQAGDARWFRSARTLASAHRWLRGQGFRRQAPRHHPDEAGYYEHDDLGQWAKVLEAPDVAQANEDEE